MDQRRAYFICGTERIGSGVLSDALWETGLAGLPDQFFHHSNIAAYSERWGARDFPEFLDRLIGEASTPNKVFGIRMVKQQTETLATNLKECGLIGPAADSWAAADYFASRFSTTQYIWLRRRDSVRQAISLWRMDKTGANRKRPGQFAPPEHFEFSYQEVEECRLLLRERDLYWGEYFEARGISPLLIHYEDDVEHSLGDTVRLILNYIGVEVPASLPIVVKREKQADAKTEDYLRLYRAAHEKAV